MWTSCLSYEPYISISVLLKLISKKFFRKFEILKSVKSLPLILRTLAFLRIMLFLVLKIINVEWMYVAIHRNLELFKVNISQSTTSHSYRVFFKKRDQNKSGKANNMYLLWLFYHKHKNKVHCSEKVHCSKKTDCYVTYGKYGVKS